jgi:electron transfer flavoprotein alpha subunit
VHVLVAGHNAGAAAAAAAQIAGVAKVIHADGASLAHGLAENVAAQVLAIAGNYSHILFPATASGKNVAPRVAAKLDVAQISDITKVDSADTFERPIYAGNAIATVQSPTPSRSSPCAAPALTRPPPRAAAPRWKRAAVADSGKSVSWAEKCQERPSRADGRQDHRPVAGRWAAREVQRSDDPLADKLGAAMGASRAAVDAGYAPNDCRWARPARSWRRSCTSPAASRARSSTWRA